MRFRPLFFARTSAENHAADPIDAGEAAIEIKSSQPSIQPLSPCRRHPRLVSQKRFQEGFKRLSDGKDRENAQKHIFEIKDTKSRHDRKEISEKFVEIGERMIARGAEAILIGCTEISIVLNPDSFTVRGFDALTILARAAVREAGIITVSEKVTRRVKIYFFLYC
jgi:hypothetical protein